MPLESKYFRHRVKRGQMFADVITLSEDKYRGDIQGDRIAQTLREKTPGVGKVPEPTTGIDTFESHQNLTDKK